MSNYSKGLIASIDIQLPNQAVTEMVNIRQIKHTIVNDPLVTEEYYTLAPRKPRTGKVEGL